MSDVQTLDDLPLLAELESPPTPKLSKAERERRDDWQRSQALRWFSIELGLRTGLRFFSLADVQRMWFEEQEKNKAEQQRQAQMAEARRRNGVE